MKATHPDDEDFDPRPRRKGPQPFVIVCVPWLKAGGGRPSKNAKWREWKRYKTRRGRDEAFAKLTQKISFYWFEKVDECLKSTSSGPLPSPNSSLKSGSARAAASP